MDKYLPIYINDNEVWYMDISKLGVKDLLNLRDELKNNNCDITKLNNIIYDETGVIPYEFKSKKKKNRKFNECRDYSSVIINVNNKVIDIANYSLSQLIELRKYIIANSDGKDTAKIDRLINRLAGPSYDIRGNIYKEEKKNKKRGRYYNIK